MHEVGFGEACLLDTRGPSPTPASKTITVPKTNSPDEIGNGGFHSRAKRVRPNVLATRSTQPVMWQLFLFLALVRGGLATNHERYCIHISANALSTFFPATGAQI